jgi:hypothetical protein
MGVLMGVAVALLVTAGPVRGDEKSHRAAVKELFKAMDLPKKMQDTLDQTLENQIKFQPPLKPYREVMRKFLVKYMSYESLEDELVSLWVKEFTENEVQELIRFYQSPVGKKVLSKQPEMHAKISQLTSKRIQANQEELKKMIEEASKNK